MGYKTERGALSQLKRFGGANTVEELATNRLGATTPLTKAMRGDVVSILYEGMPALGIVIGHEACFMHVKHGLVRVPIAQCNLAWSV